MESAHAVQAAGLAPETDHSFIDFDLLFDHPALVDIETDFAGGLLLDDLGFHFGRQVGSEDLGGRFDRGDAIVDI